MIQGGTSTHAYQTFIMLTSCTVAKQAMNLRPESDSPPGSPEPSLPWSPPCARTRAHSEVELQRLWAAHAAGKAGSRPPPRRRQPAFPRSLPGPGCSRSACCLQGASNSHAFGDEPARSSAARCPSATSRVPVFHLISAPALYFCPCTGGWRCPGCARAPGPPGALGMWALLLSGGCSPVLMCAGGLLQRGQPGSCRRGACVAGGHGHGRGDSCVHGHGCARVGTGVQTHVPVCACMRACASAWAWVCMCIHVHAHLHVCACMCVHAHAHVCAWVCTHTCMGVHARVHVQALAASPQLCAVKPELSPWRALASCARFVQSLTPKLA